MQTGHKGGFFDTGECERGLATKTCLELARLPRSAAALVDFLELERFAAQSWLQCKNAPAGLWCFETLMELTPATQIIKRRRRSPERNLWPRRRTTPAAPRSSDTHPQPLCRQSEERRRGSAG